MIAIIALSLSSLVILAGLYLLSRTKKDNLGTAYLFSSYAAISLGILLFVGTAVGGVMKMCCKHSMTSSQCVMQSKCHMGGMANCESSCSMKGHSGHAMMMGHGMASKCGQGSMYGKMHGKCAKKCHGGESCENPDCPHRSGEMKKRSIEEKVIVEEIEEDEE